MKITRFLRLSVLLSIIISLEAEIISQDSEKSKELKANSLVPRKGRASLIAFQPFGNKVNLGLDILLPFVKVPTKRKLDQMGKDDALLTVNTAALTIGGLISGLGILVGHLLKSLVFPQAREENGDEEQKEEKDSDESESAEDRNHVDKAKDKISRMLEPFKFVYRNSTGERVDASIPSLFKTIEGTFLENDIDLVACIQKSLCTLIQRSADNMSKGTATGIEKMIDGISQLQWLKSLIRETAIEEAFLLGRSPSRDNCNFKYPTCKWTEPDQQIYELISKRVKFE